MIRTQQSGSASTQALNNKDVRTWSPLQSRLLLQLGANGVNKKNIPLSTRNQDDFSAWHFERTSVFSIRSAYRALKTTKRTREGWLKGKLAPFTSVDEGVESPLTEGGYYKNMFYLSSESLEKKWLFSMIKSMSEADLTWMLVLAPVVRLVSSVSAGRVDLCA
jgi:hypothetical protein